MNYFKFFLINFVVFNEIHELYQFKHRGRAEFEVEYKGENQV